MIDTVDIYFSFSPDDIVDIQISLSSPFLLFNYYKNIAHYNKV